jgi:hypothetical protein
VTAKFLYLGPVDLKGDKKGVALRKITDDEFTSGQLEGVLLPERAIYDNVRFYSISIKKYLMGSPGSVYEVEETEKGLVLSSAKYLGLWKTEGDRLAWQAEARVYEQEQKAKRDQKLPQGLDKHVIALNMAYHSLSVSRRSQLLAWMVHQITTG